LVFGEEVTHLGQVKHLMHPIRLIMGQHLATTAGAIRRRIVRDHGRVDGVPAAVLTEAVLQLGNPVQQLIYELVGLVEGQRVSRRCRVLFGHARKHAIRAGSCNRQMRIKRRSSHFVNPLSVNGYVGRQFIV
jgi:hypothetical protein